jgi:hypothetical protein
VKRRVLLPAFGVGALAGLAWGVVARGFMRLLAEYPEFTWSGTLAIVGSATVVGGLVAGVRAARLSGRSRWWRLLGLPFVLLFGAAGMLLLPGVVGVVMLLDRRRWLSVPGVSLVGVTVYAVVLQDLGGSLTLQQSVGVVIMLACLAVEGWAARELVRRWRPAAEATGAGPDRSEFPDAVEPKVLGVPGESRSIAP